MLVYQRVVSSPFMISPPPTWTKSTFPWHPAIKPCRECADVPILPCSPTKSTSSQKETYPNAPCRKHILTFALECCHVQPNVGKQTIQFTWRIWDKKKYTIEFVDICVCDVCDFCWVFAGSCLQLGLIKKIPYPFGSSFQTLTLQILSHWTARFLTVAQVSSDVLAGGLGYVGPVKKHV